jgi:hypothetical protein
MTRNATIANSIGKILFYSKQLRDGITTVPLAVLSGISLPSDSQRLNVDTLTPFNLAASDLVNLLIKLL